MFAFFLEKTSWAYSKTVFGSTGVYICVCILNNRGIALEHTLKLFDWTDVPGKYFRLSRESWLNTH